MFNKVAVGAAVMMALAAGGCQSDRNVYDPEKPLDKMTKDEWCNYYTYYLTNPSISDATRKTALAQMRNRGCPGHA